MNTNLPLERCQAFISSQLQPGGHGSYVDETAPPRQFVTLSRQTGCGAHATAEQLAAYLQAHEPPGTCPWTVFDHNLVEQVLQDHDLPKRFEKYMPEDRTSEIADIMDELFDLHPSSWTLVHKTSQTILRLAELGNCILIGRGAHVITSRLSQGFHVRLVGSLDRRVERIQHFEHLSRAAALELARTQDRGRARYLQKYFGKDIDDPLLYHLVINTDWVDCPEAARLIGEAVLNRRQDLRKRAGQPPTTVQTT